MRLRTEATYIALHAELAEELRLSGIPEAKIEVIPNGVDLPEKPSHSLDVPSVLCVGNFTQGASHKGFDVLFDAWDVVRRSIPDGVLTMVGGGNIEVWMQKVIDLGCADSVNFTGSVSDPAAYYHQATLFVLPSRHEGMSNALLEAQSHGVCSVVSNIAGNRAVVESGHNGVVVPVGDAEALALAILELLQDPDRRIEMGKAARARMASEFARPVVSERILNLYECLTGQQ
jgi:glycosyltransferase involved in cell wall biosynthesis